MSSDNPWGSTDDSLSPRNTGIASSAGRFPTTTDLDSDKILNNLAAPEEHEHPWQRSSTSSSSSHRYDDYEEPTFTPSTTSYPPPAPNPFVNVSSNINNHNQMNATSSSSKTNTSTGTSTRPKPRPIVLNDEINNDPIHSGASTTSTTTTTTTSSYRSEMTLGGFEGELDGPMPLPVVEKSIGKGKERIVLGVAVVDFNHLVGPVVEFSYPPSLTSSLEKDQELTKLLPFLALPDGAHLSEEDYSYFHAVYRPSSSSASSNSGSPDPSLAQSELPTSQTIFGISCNRQLPSSELLHRPEDVTRSTVQKAVVVLAARPVFGPIRDKLGVVTRAFFAQRDFTQTDLLPQFYDSLEAGLAGKENESGMYIGTSLRELIHKFRHKTLLLVKLMMLQKRIMFFGYPVERLCTLQYSLLSLMPGLLFNLSDCGDASLDFRSTVARRPSSLRTSDRNSLLRYMGLPLHTFGLNSFFQPYLPLQQIETLVAKSWLVGTTNSIVTQQRDAPWDLLVNIEQTTFEFRDPKLEKLVALTASDRAWMDEVVKAVEESWNPSDPTRAKGMGFKGSDDDLRSRFEEYICASLASLKYADFMASSGTAGIGMMGIGQGPAFKADPSGVLQPFSEAWLAAFRETEACKIWNKSTDPLLFDICEPRHPCEGKANAVSDIGIRLTEGLHDLHLDQQLGPTKEVLGQAFAAGSSTLFRAFDGVRSEVSNRLREREVAQKAGGPSTSPSAPAADTARTLPTVPDLRSAIGGFGSGIGSFFGSLQQAAASRNAPATPKQPERKGERRVSGLKPMTLGTVTSNPPSPTGSFKGSSFDGYYPSKGTP